MPSLREAHRRHAKYYLTVIRTALELFKVGGDALKRGLDMFDGEWENIRRGQRWSFANMWQEAEAAEMCSDYPLAGLQLLKLRQESHERLRWLEQAITAARNLGKRDVECSHLISLGLAHMELGDPASAVISQDQALEIAREIGAFGAQAAALSNLGMAYARLGEVSRAKQLHEESLAVFHKPDDPDGKNISKADQLIEANAMGGLGTAYYEMGDYERAIELLKKCLTLSRKAGNRTYESDALRNLSSSYWSAGKPNDAKKHADEALKIAREIGDRRAEGLAMICLGNAYASLQEPKRAFQLYQRCLQLLRDAGDKYGEDIALWNIDTISHRLDVSPQTHKESFKTDEESPTTHEKSAKTRKKWWKFWST